jgi:adenosylmethionine-8-amino-7-oxononanoate aminotransferase
LGAYEEFKTFFHGHTYTGNPLGTAVGLASLDIFAQDRVLDGLPAKIAQLSGRLENLNNHPHVGDIRQRGLMVGIELVADKGSRETFPLERRTGNRVILAARKLGAILRPWGCHRPPATAVYIAEELDTLCDIVQEAIDQGTKNGYTIRA